jgi:hypothetical protein
LTFVAVRLPAKPITHELPSETVIVNVVKVSVAEAAPVKFVPPIV